MIKFVIGLYRIFLNIMLFYKINLNLWGVVNYKGFRINLLEILRDIVFGMLWEIIIYFFVWIFYGEVNIWFRYDL